MGKSSPFFEHPSLVIFGDFCRPCSVRKSTSSPWMFWEALSKGGHTYRILGGVMKSLDPIVFEGIKLGGSMVLVILVPGFACKHAWSLGWGWREIRHIAGWKELDCWRTCCFSQVFNFKGGFLFFLKIPYLGDLMFFFEVSQIVYTLRISHDLTSHWWFGDPIQNPAKTRVIHLYFLEGPMILRVYNIVIYFEIYIYIYSGEES